MNSRVLILIGFLVNWALINTSRAQMHDQYSPPRNQTTRTNQQAGDASLIPRQQEPAPTDLRPKYQAALRQKNDGDFLLYTGEEGTRIYLPMKGGHLGAIHALGKSGKNVTLRFSTERGQCFVCWGPLCKYKIQVQCPTP